MQWMIVNSVKRIFNKIQVEVKCSHENRTVDELKFFGTFLCHFCFSNFFSFFFFFLLCLVAFFFVFKIVTFKYLEGIFDFPSYAWQPILVFSSLEQIVEYSLDLQGLLDPPPFYLICSSHFSAQTNAFELTLHEIHKSHQLWAACLQVFNWWCVGGINDFLFEVCIHNKVKTRQIEYGVQFCFLNLFGLLLHFIDWLIWDLSLFSQDHLGVIERARIFLQELFQHVVDWPSLILNWGVVPKIYSPITFRELRANLILVPKLKTLRRRPESLHDVLLVEFRSAVSGQLKQFCLCNLQLKDAICQPPTSPVFCRL